MEHSINVVLLHTTTYITTVTTQPLAHIHIVHRWEIVYNRYIIRHMLHTHGKLPTFFYGHFNMSSLCDIKCTLVGTERGSEGEWKREAMRQGGRVRG